MRTLLLASLCLILLAFGKKEDHPTRFVWDHENTLSAEEEKRLDTLFRGHEMRTTNEIALVTTRDYHGNPDMQTFAATCGDSLQVGKKRKNNGVVIVFSRSLREVYIATGVGTEQVLPEEQCERIIDSLMVPLFKEDMFFDGLWKGSTALVNHLEAPGNEIR